MCLDSDISVQELKPIFRMDKLRVPLKFGQVVVRNSVSMIVEARVRNREGEVSQGWGAMPLVAKWAFPDPEIGHQKKLELMNKIGKESCKTLEENWSGKYGHPLDIMWRERSGLFSLSENIARKQQLGCHPPDLLVLVSTSALDLALHDAFGRVNGICSFDGYGPEYMDHDLSRYLGTGFQDRYISEYLKPSYSRDLPVFHLVGALDKLTEDQVNEEDPDDGLPVSLDEWIRREGIYCFKVKLSGVDVDWDVERTADVAQVASMVLEELGREEFYLSVDANEMNQSPRATVDYLSKLKRRSPEAFDRLVYLEQPTERDMERHMFSMSEVDAIKPVVADEGVTGLESFELAMELGWSGVALKTCKWLSSALLLLSKMGPNNLPYSIQDLTCPGIALVNSASLAARTSPMGFEYNARQYLPFAYPEVQDSHPTLFNVEEGRIRTDSLSPLGLGLDEEAIGYFDEGAFQEN